MGAGVGWVLQAQAERFGECRQFGARAFPPAAIKDDHWQFALGDLRIEISVPWNVLAGLYDLTQLTRLVRQRDQVAGREDRHRKSPLVGVVIHPMTDRATLSVVEAHSHT